MSFRILLTGASGQLGWELRRSLAPLGTVIVPERNAFDLAFPETLRPSLRELRPDLIVNAAAYTAVDQAEREAALADRINNLAVAAMAEFCSETGAGLLHFSTDYVFDGPRSRPWEEDEDPLPSTEYGRSKLRGEQAILRSGCAGVVLRTSWVYATRGRNFLRTVLRLAREKQQLCIVNDQVGAPTSARALAEVTLSLLSGLGSSLQSLTELNRHRGVYHAAAAGQTTWFDFARAILEAVPDPQRKCRELIPISTSEYPTQARRPLYSKLSCDKLFREFGIQFEPWQTALQQALDGVWIEQLVS